MIQSKYFLDGTYPYEAAKIIAQSGKVEALEFDTASGEIKTSSSVGISAEMDFAFAVWNFYDKESAIERVILSRINNETLSNAVPNLHLRDSVDIEKDLAKSLAVKASHYVGDKIQTNDIDEENSLVSRLIDFAEEFKYIARYGADAKDLIKGRISAKQFFKNAAITTAGVASTTITFALSTFTSPIFIFLQGYGGKIWFSQKMKSILNCFIDDDSEKMLAILGDKLAEMLNGKFLTPYEMGLLMEALRDDINQDALKEMYACKTRDKQTEWARLYIERRLEEILEQRIFIEMPTQEDWEAGIRRINEHIYAALLTFFQKTRAEIVQIGVTIAQHEKDIKLLKWKGGIKYQLYKGCAYKKLDTITKIVCLTRDFYEINEGTWSTADLLLLETALADVGLEPEKEINLKDFIGQVGNDIDLSERLLAGTGQFATENEEIVFALKQPEAFVSNAEVTCYEFVLELLYNLRQLEYNKELYEKLQAAKELFLSCKIEEALPLLEKTADAGKDEARYMLSVLYKEGLAVEKNPERATALLAGTVAEDCPDELKQAADGGDVFAQYELAQYHLREAVRYLKQSADQNYFLAAHELGLMYYAGVGVEKDYNKAKECFELSADMGHGLSMAYLANIYRKKIDCSTVSNFQAGINETDSFLNKIGNIFFEKLRVLGNRRLIYNAILKVIECYEKAYIYDKNIASRYDDYFEELHICKINRFILESLKKMMVLLKIRLPSFIGREMKDLCLTP